MLSSDAPDIDQRFQAVWQDVQAEDLEAAETGARAMIAQWPDESAGYYALGIILRRRKEYPAAESALRMALQRQPSLWAAENALAGVFLAMERYAEAEVACRRALKMAPHSAELWAALGRVQQARRDWEAAERTYRQALVCNPNSVLALSRLAGLMHQLRRDEEAEQFARQALTVAPREPSVHADLAAILITRARVEEAEAAARQALNLDPRLARCWNQLGIVLHLQGLSVESHAAFRHAAELEPTAHFHSNLLLNTQYLPDVSLAALQEAHREWNDRFVVPLRNAGDASTGEATRPTSPLPAGRRQALRLGFVSGDLAMHPVGCFLIRIAEALSARGCELYFYSDRFIEDEMTQRFRRLAAGWQSTLTVPDDEVAEAIRQDRLDALFDLSGHTENNRLLVFARRPARIQVTWMGYVGTTGVETIDYLLADRHHVRPEEEPFYTERVLRMPDGYVCYEPPGDAPPVGPLPCLSGRPFTFASFSNPGKINPRVIGLWARILNRVKGSELVLRYKGFDQPRTQERYRALLAEAGADPGRLHFKGWGQQREVLTQYGQVDLALDPFPYSGGLTTCEALWMGVPVITWPGQTFAGRHSLSHLSTAGLTETIAASPEEYVDLAVRLAEDRPRLSELREKLRPLMERSPLCDGPRFADQLLALLGPIVQGS